MDNIQDSPATDDPAFRHRLASRLWDANAGYDLFQMFEVCETKCRRIRVHVINGENISNGTFGDFLDTPDPYVLLSIPKTPNGVKRTRTVDNCKNPTWDNIFYFYINPDIRNDLCVTLVDANVLKDSKMGSVLINLDDLKLNVEADITVMFRKGKVFLKICKEENSHSDLRFGLSLCDEEQAFLKKRRCHVLNGMKNFLGEEFAPTHEEEVPTIAVLGSGGGVRALVGYSGVFNALQEIQLMDCIMFSAALSGSSWFLSYLYSQPDFPNKGAMEYQAELREILSQNMIKLFNPINLYQNISAMVKKYAGGQPVSLTDLFGLQLGDLLLRKHKDVRLSQQRSVVENGQTPLPLYTCINVKKNVSARVFQEWVEFSPYEIGVSKYGTYTKPENFGSKFYLGNIIRKFEEPPLHFLQGIWGSAYSIQFRRLLREMCRMPNNEIEKGTEPEQEEEEEEDEDIMKYMPCDDLDDGDDDDNTSENDVESHESDISDTENMMQHSSNWSSFIENTENESITHQTMEFLTTEIHFEERSRRSDMDRTNTSGDSQQKCNPWKLIKKEKRMNKQRTKRSLLETTVDSLLSNSIANSRVLRAGVIYNGMRGLQLKSVIPVPDVPPTDPTDEDDFKGIFEATDVEKKKLYLVDSGLTFNLPFPVLLRSQRAVDMYLAFDFSVRDTDDSPPFEEILLAEKWAKLLCVPFPPIREEVDKFSKDEPLKECYIFEDSKDEYCPIVLYFPLVNNKFREFKAPGVKRETVEEKEFGNFDIFSDPKKPYHTFKFRYSHQTFDRLSKLMEFNIKYTESVIREYMKKAVERKRRLLPKPAWLNEIRNIPLKPKNQAMWNELQRYIKSIEEA